MSNNSEYLEAWQEIERQFQKLTSIKYLYKTDFEDVIRLHAKQTIEKFVIDHYKTTNKSFETMIEIHSFLDMIDIALNFFICDAKHYLGDQFTKQDHGFCFYRIHTIYIEACRKFLGEKLTLP